MKLSRKQYRRLLISYESPLCYHDHMKIANSWQLIQMTSKLLLNFQDLFQL